MAWMQQEDNFFNMLSVQETLEFAAFLELPEHSETQRRERMTSVMESLGLIKLKNRMISNLELHNGLSGGQKRRLSLALELISVLMSPVVVLTRQGAKKLLVSSKNWFLKGIYLVLFPCINHNHQLSKCWIFSFF